MEKWKGLTLWVLGVGTWKRKKQRDNKGCVLNQEFIVNNNFQPNVHWLSQNVIIFCIISSVMHAFWLVLTYDLLENRRIDDIIKTFFNFLLYKTNRFQVVVHLFSNRSQMTSKCGKNKKVAHEVQLSVSLMFLPHFGIYLLKGS